MQRLLQMTNRFKLTLAEGQRVEAIQVDACDELDTALAEIGLTAPYSVLVIVGGASKLNEDDFARLQSLFVQVLAPLAQSLNMMVIDGGTDAGVMRLMGQARKSIGGTFPLVGVVPTGLADFPENKAPLSKDASSLEPNHTHFILIPGLSWGSESPWIARVATVLSANKPSIAILANGGEISWRDAQQNVQADRPVIVVEGSGRTADILAQALHGTIMDDRAQQLVDSRLLQSIEMAEDFQDIDRALRQILEKK